MCKILMFNSGSVEYFVIVEWFFIIFCCRGLMLFGYDVVLVYEWERVGILVEVLCRVIVKGAR